jgi:hypothetical protein
VPVACVTGLLIAAPALLPALAAAEEALLVPPCAGTASPDYPEKPGMAEVDIWLGADEAGGWSAPACLAWDREQATVLAAVAGRFRHAGDSDALLARLAAVSRHVDIEYWSISKRAWRPLVESSQALSKPDPSATRPDFTLDELGAGDHAYVLQDESGPVGAMILEFEIVERGPDVLVVNAENLSPGEMLFKTLFEAGGSKTRFWLQREAGDIWTYYSLSRLAGSSLLGSGFLRRSYANRAAAMFHFLTATEASRRPL